MRKWFAVPLSLILAAPLGALRSSDLADNVKQYVTVDAAVVALTNVALIDGTGAAVRHRQTIIIENGWIRAVGNTGDVHVPAGADVHDLTGHTVIPGMMGLHNHMYYTGAAGRAAQLSFSAPRLYLGTGVTTIRTTGSRSPYAEINTKTAIDEGRSPGPRMHITAPYITGGEDAGTMARVDTPEQARRFVAYWAEEGATWIKAYTGITRAALGAAIEEAHRHGVRVTAHLWSVTFREAVDLGIDNLEHGLSTASDFVSSKQPDEFPGMEALINLGDNVDMDGELVRETIRYMIDHNVPLTSTMSVLEPIVKSTPPPEDLRVYEAMTPEVKESYLALRKQIDAGAFGFTEVAFRNFQEFEKRFVDAGGLLASGVDPTGSGGTLPGFGDQRNYELFIVAGFDPGTAVQIMTLNGAKILGVDAELGSVEVGKRADLAVIDGDLDADPSRINHVTIVFKDGVGYDSAKLIESVNGMVGIR